MNPNFPCGFLRVIVVATTIFASLFTSLRAATPDEEFAALNEAKAALGRPPASPKDMGFEKYLRWMDEARQKLNDSALAFYDQHPTDARRWEAVMMASAAMPLFIVSVGPEVETKGMQAVVADEGKKTAWINRMDALQGMLLTSSDAAPTAKEEVEWGNFAKNFRGSAEAKMKGEPADFGPFRARFDRHVAKYAQLPNLGDRARDYLGALESLMPGTSEVEWQRQLDSPNEGLKKAATEQLAKLARMAALKTKPFELAFTAASGRLVDVAKLRGKVVLIDFWATWCGPCIAELPNVKKVYAAYHDKGFEIIGISLENGKLTPKDTPEQRAAKLEAAKKILTDFTTKEEMPWPQYFDGKWWKNDVSTQYEINSIPAMFLLDLDGKVVSTNARGPNLEAEVKRLLKL